MPDLSPQRARVAEAEDHLRVFARAVEIARARQAETSRQTRERHEAKLRPAYAKVLREFDEALAVASQRNKAVAEFWAEAQATAPGVLPCLHWAEPDHAPNRFEAHRQRIRAYVEPPKPKPFDGVAVRILKHWSAKGLGMLVKPTYNPGEVAGFTKSQAEALIEAGVAERVEG